MTRRLAAMFAFLTASAAAGQHDPVVFPGAVTLVESPDGAWVVTWTRKAKPEADHALGIRNTRTGAARRLQTFGRWASVLWSDDTRHVAVTDGAGSDYADAWVYDPTGRYPRLDVCRKATTSLRSQWQR